MMGTELRKLIMFWQSLRILAALEKIIRRMLIQDIARFLLSGQVDFLWSFDCLCKQWMCKIPLGLTGRDQYCVSKVSKCKKIHKCFHTHTHTHTHTHMHARMHKHTFAEICLAWTRCMCGTWLETPKSITEFPNHLQWLISFKNTWVIQLISVTL